MKAFTAGKNEEGVRLSRFVQSVTINLPTSLLYKSFRNKRIKVNGKRGDADTRLHEGDEIELYIVDAFFGDASAPTKKESKAKGKNIPAATVIFEDENICVLFKPAHLLCHGDNTGDVSLVDVLRRHLEESGSYTPAAENSFAPSLCNRLDRGTEGLVVGAKNYASLRDMNEIIRCDLLRKEYLCITVGAPPQGRHTAYLRHREKDNKVTVQNAPAEGFKEIITEVHIEARNGPFCLCRIGLITGRTHQIRAHLAFLGAPVLGDIKYGSRKMNERYGVRTQALCAVSVTWHDIPTENTLCYLNGQCVKLEKPEILDLYKSLQKA